MFDNSLFYKICRKYNVELSNLYNKVMFRDGNKIHPLVAEDIEQMIPYYSIKIKRRKRE